jgi:hypothetical protein
MSFYSNEAVTKIPTLLYEQNEKIDDLIAAILTLAEITDREGLSIDGIFAQKRELLKNRK